MTKLGLLYPDMKDFSNLSNGKMQPFSTPFQLVDLKSNLFSHWFLKFGIHREISS